MPSGVEAEAAGHCAAGLPVCAERATCAGTREECAEHETAAGPSAAPPARGEPAEETAGERDAERKAQSQGEPTHCAVDLSVVFGTGGERSLGEIKSVDGI